jgi:hypothetical protein
MKELCYNSKYKRSCRLGGVMNNWITIERGLLETERAKNNLPKVEDFTEQNITSEDIEKLFPLIQLPIGLTEQIQLSKEDLCRYHMFRLKQIFGNVHINVRSKTIEYSYDKESKVYVYEVEVNIQIGNYKFFVDDSRIPYTNFIKYYESRGLSVGSDTSRYDAKKSAIIDATLEALYNMGCESYGLKEILISERKNIVEEGNLSNRIGHKEELKSCDIINNINEQNKSGKNVRHTILKFKDTPKFYSNDKSSVYLMRTIAHDINQNKDVSIIVYKENTYNQKVHKELTDFICQNTNMLGRDKELKVEYSLSKTYTDTYVISKIFAN